MTVRHALADARAVARELSPILEPHCERIEVVGSVRRGRRDVHDVELLCISKVRRCLDLFGDVVEEISELNAHLDALVDGGDLLHKRPNKLGRYTYGPLNKLLVHVPSGIPVDVFSTTSDNWGMALLVRTGPAEFNVSVMQRFRDLGMRGHAYAGVTDHTGRELACPDEETVFELLGWEFIDPMARR